MSVAVHVVETGLANLASVEAGIRRAGGRPVRVRSAHDVERAGRLVLPGVGTFGAAMNHLRETGLSDPLRSRITEGRPTLAVCLGLQLIAESSEESPGVEGLGIVRASVRRYPAGVRVPQFGWGRVAGSDAGFEDGFAYFANSFCLDSDPGDGWRVAWSTHGIPFVAALARGGVLACQFHPELSATYGQGLLDRWVRGGTGS